VLNEGLLVLARAGNFGSLAVMSKELAYEFGEAGFERMRFGRPIPSGCYSIGLAEVLPLLIRVADKSKLSVNGLSDSLITEIINVCARARIELVRDVNLEDCVVVSLNKRILRLSGIQPCGLRDLIFSSCLFRTYAYMGHPEYYNLGDLIAETWVMLADELPQSLTYSTAAELRSMVNHGYLHRNLGGSADIHFHAA